MHGSCQVRFVHRVQPVRSGDPLPDRPFARGKKRRDNFPFTGRNPSIFLSIAVQRKRPRGFDTIVGGWDGSPLRAAAPDRAPYHEREVLVSVL